MEFKQVPLAEKCNIKTYSTYIIKTWVATDLPEGAFGTIHVLTLCPGQSHDIHCEPGSFVYIEDAIYGHDENVTTERCSIPIDDFCSESTEDFVSFTTEKSITDIRVPRRHTTCPDRQQWPLNFVQIEYVCVQGKLRWCGLLISWFCFPYSICFCEIWHISALNIYSKHWAGIGSWNPSSQDTTNTKQSNKTHAHTYI